MTTDDTTYQNGPTTVNTSVTSAVVYIGTEVGLACDVTCIVIILVVFVAVAVLVVVALFVGCRYWRQWLKAKERERQELPPPDPQLDDFNTISTNLQTIADLTPTPQIEV